MSDQEAFKQHLHENTAMLDTLWHRMKYMGKADYTVEWEEDSPIVYWHGQRLGSAQSLNEGSMEHLADILDKARKDARKAQ